MIVFFQRMIDLATTAGIRLIGAILIMIIGFTVTNKLVKLFKTSKKAEKLEKSVVDFLSSFISIALKVVITLTAANYLGVPMTNLVAIVGSCGLAVGLALQGSLANLAGGIMILIFKPCKDGDYISVNGLEGTVKEITILYTYLTTPDNMTVIIPNASISNAAITNYSAEPLRRADVNVTVSSGNDVNKVRDILLDYARNTPNVEKDPDCAVAIAYGECSVTFTVRAWVKNENYWDVIGTMNYGMQKLLSDNNIELAVPRLNVQMDK